MMHYPDGARPAEHIAQSVTRVVMWPGFDDPDFVDLTLSTDNDRRLIGVLHQLAPEDRAYAVGVHEIEHLLEAHSGGAKPDWVDSDDPEFAKALADYYKCSLGEPVALLTNNGRDALHQQMFTTATQPAAFTYIALTASTVAPAAIDITLAGEITTAGGGLIRALATFAHTTGTTTTTLTKTFTANASDTLPVSIAQIGVFNAATGITLAFHTALSGTATLSVIGDNVTITETVTAS